MILEVDLEDTMNFDTKLSSQITVFAYLEMVKQKDKEKIINFIRERFTERYITPLKVDLKKKNGFTIMAIACLMIETLESFYQGWPNTIRKSQLAFSSFFERNKNFHFIKSFGQSFYRHVRCGILHQAETTGGWCIQRAGPIFNEQTKTINASKFLIEVENALLSYCSQLSTANWEDEIWKKFRKKMSSICGNCKS